MILFDEKVHLSLAYLKFNWQLCLLKSWLDDDRDAISLHMRKRLKTLNLGT